MDDQAKKKPNYEPWYWIAALILTLVGVWYVNERAFLRGQLSRNAEVTDLNSKLSNGAILLAQCNLKGEQAKPVQQAQRDMATAALDAATKPNKKHSAKLSESLDKLNALRDAPGIAGTTK